MWPGIKAEAIDTTTHNLRAVFETNVFGALETTRAVLPHLQQSSVARIVNGCRTTLTTPRQVVPLDNRPSGSRPVKRDAEGSAGAVVVAGRGACRHRSVWAGAQGVDRPGRSGDGGPVRHPGDGPAHPSRVALRRYCRGGVRCGRAPGAAPTRSPAARDHRRRRGARGCGAHLPSRLRGSGRVGLRGRCTLWRPGLGAP